MFDDFSGQQMTVTVFSKMDGTPTEAPGPMDPPTDPPTSAGSSQMGTAAASVVAVAGLFAWMA